MVQRLKEAQRALQVRAIKGVADCDGRHIHPYPDQQIGGQGRYLESWGVCQMKQSVLIVSAIAALVISPRLASSALAQGQGQKTYKRSCQEVCVEKCQTSIRKDYCLGNCPAKCQMIRSEKTKS
jgi:hypothetical protein